MMSKLLLKSGLTFKVLEKSSIFFSELRKKSYIFNFNHDLKTYSLTKTLRSWSNLDQACLLYIINTCEK